MEIVSIIVIIATVAYAAYLHFRDQVFKLPEASALDEPINFHKLADDPARLAGLADKVSSVGIIRIGAQPGGRNEIPEQYEAFVVDANGVPNTFAMDTDYRTVRDKAKWLADELDVPLNDASQ